MPWTSPRDTWADVQHLAHVLVIKPIVQPFVIASTGNRLHLCDEAIEARQQFLVGTALNWNYFHVCLVLKFAGKGTSWSPERPILKISYCEITIQGNKNPMSAELAHQKADKHLCVALHRKLRIRLHPSAVFVWGIIMCTISLNLPKSMVKMQEFRIKMCNLIKMLLTWTLFAK